jgi:F-type H+-transporting ATPase subunit gamma
MADAKQLKVKIHSTQNIKKITNALEIISTLKLQKVKKKTINLRECMLSLIDVVASIDSYEHIFTLPRATDTASGRSLLIVVGTEKGLCGSLNTTLFKHVHGLYENQKHTIDLYAVGKKTREYFSRRDYTVTQTTLLGDVITHEMSHELLETVSSARKAGIYTSITICYNIFKNTMKYIPVVFPLSPMNSAQLHTFLEQMEGSPMSESSPSNRHHKTSLLIEPSVESMRETIYQMLMEYVIYGALLQNKTCEFASRMLAMKWAKDNATNQISSLTLSYNKARQDAITREIIEVCGAKSVIE